MSRYERNTGIRGTLGSIFGPPTASYQDEVMRPSVLEKEEIKVESALELEQSYKGRHVIVTGASGAIGSEVAKILLNAGAKVVLFGRDNKNMSFLAKYHGKKNTNLFTYTLDFAFNPLSLDTQFRNAMKDLKGVLHTLIICHGNVFPGSLTELNLLNWDECMNLNVRSIFMTVSLAIPFLKLQKDEDPNVCIVTGDAGFNPYPGFAAHSVAKAMINSFIECAALEMAYFGIRINGVAPSLTTKCFQDLQGEDTKNKGVEKTLHIGEAQIPFEMHPLVIEELGTYPDPKITEAEEIADAICWL
eukprot:CAMPEP_0197015558 /NCGR_PEP_ID=MMETSP1380-20130617/74708_1 /TAXON_ID=5936 /ORGANISM="Euplotes crassus, Strain CT5" /LENGTH=301 /DNA_ID=CAMNT_0042441557 /DNA_START=12 /DNA_END=917 /DNA_ORIENTATION=-